MYQGKVEDTIDVHETFLAIINVYITVFDFERHQIHSGKSQLYS